MKKTEKQVETIVLWTRLCGGEQEQEIWWYWPSEWSTSKNKEEMTESTRNDSVIMTVNHVWVSKSNVGMTEDARNDAVIALLQWSVGIHTCVGAS